MVLSRLEDIYINLLKNRLNLKKLANEEQTLNSAYNNSQIRAYSNYYNYILYLLIAIFLLILFIKSSLTFKQQNGGSTLNIKNLNSYFMIIVILILSFFLFK